MSDPLSPPRTMPRPRLVEYGDVFDSMVLRATACPAWTMPVEVDWIGHVAPYPMSVPQPCFAAQWSQAQPLVRGLDALAKRGHRFVSIPPAIRRGSPSARQQA